MSQPVSQPMSEIDPSRLVFVEEAQELLTELESALLELEDDPEDQELVNRVFRAMHTIKGSGAMFGFDDIARFTHEVETVFDRVRNGELQVTTELLSLSLAARDNIQYLLDCAVRGEVADMSGPEAVLTNLRQCLGQDVAVSSSESAPSDSGPVSAADDTEPAPILTYLVRFKPSQDIFRTGTDPFCLLDEMADLGHAAVVAHLDEIPDLAEYDPEACYTRWDVILSTDASLDRIKDVFIFVEDSADLDIRVVDAPDAPGLLDDSDQAGYKKLGEILVERGDVQPEILDQALKAQPRLGEILTKSGVGKSLVESALTEQAVVRQARSARKSQEADATNSLRVAADKLDYLVDLVGELVIVQAQISQVVGQREDAVLTGLAEELERLSNELRDSTLGIRMIPMGSTFSKFRRLVRDLSAELGKEIELVTYGAETELDKTVIEKLNDPLIHLLRNSIDHGVERPEQRQAAGKDSKGTIILSAEHSGGDVLISITDDGKGMDPARIRAKALERGLIPSDADLSTKEILNLVFMPGFSTADSVTSVSGRGVGMDVVKRAIIALRGSIDIKSELGRGTTITVKLPLTLAIIDGLQVHVGDEYYVMPLSVVEECVELAHKPGEKTGDARIINLRGEVVPYIRLREWFGVPGQSPDIEQIVITSVDGGRIGIVVDNVIGEHQTVIKSLGRVYKDIQGISGATIKGDGSMALILDVPGLVRLVMTESRHRN